MKDLTSHLDAGGAGPQSSSVLSLPDAQPEDETRNREPFQGNLILIPVKPAGFRPLFFEKQTSGLVECLALEVKCALSKLTAEGVLCHRHF